MSDPRRVPLLAPASPLNSTHYYPHEGLPPGSAFHAEHTQVQSVLVAPAGMPLHELGNGLASSSVAVASEEEEEDRPVRFPSVIVMPGLWQWLFFILVGVFAALAFTVLKHPLQERGITSSDVLRYGSIPLISIVFTYLHIWLALWMTFYPIEFFGCLQIPGTNVGLGWQGIIPFKAEKMARMATQLMTQRLFDVRSIFARLQPDHVASEMGAALHHTLEETISSVARLHSPDLWDLLPARVKSELVTQAHEDAPPAIAKLMLQMQANITELFDIEAMVVDTLMRDKPLLNNIFIECGHAELSFIRNSGAYMGGLFGAVQMIIWIFWEEKFMLPAFGFVVGVLTNWLALKMIFEPVQPHYPCGSRGLRVQGLFLQRQKEVSAVYARTISRRVLNSKNILAALVAGPMTDRLFALVHEHVKTVVDEYAGVSRAVLNVTVGAQLYARIKEDVCARFLERMPSLLLSLEAYTDRALDMERTIREKMEALPPEEFEGLLHPVFKEDEWKLVLMGGVLGVAIGFAQIYILGG